MENSNIIEFGKECFDYQSIALREIMSRLGEDFAQTVTAIHESKGKVVVVGVGKSAHIARKMVATFNSTGTVAQYLHATEAMHGDLGLIQPNDVVIATSKSGETQEIRQVLPHLKRQGSILVAITGNPRSYLALHANYTLDVGVNKEVDGLNLAPTTSTTAQLVMGDALAISLMKLKGFSAEDFAQFHPGGSLGKRLLWQVQDVVDTTQKPKVNENSHIHEVIHSLTSGRYGITVVCDEQNHVLGVITDGDIRRMIEQTPNYQDYRAKDIANFNPKTIPTTTPATDALKLLREHKIGQLVVTDSSGEYYGIIDVYSLISEGFSE